MADVQPTIDAVEPLFEDKPPVIYANYVASQVTAYEAVLTFCRLDPRYIEDRTDSDGSRKMVLVAPVQFQAILPIPVLEELSKILQKQIEDRTPATGAKTKGAKRKPEVQR